MAMSKQQLAYILRMKKEGKYKPKKVDPLKELESTQEGVFKDPLKSDNAFKMLKSKYLKPNKPKV